jgi:hypothetical protein
MGEEPVTSETPQTTEAADDMGEEPVTSELPQTTDADDDMGEEPVTSEMPQTTEAADDLSDDAQAYGEPDTFAEEPFSILEQNIISLGSIGRADVTLETQEWRATTQTVVEFVDSKLSREERWHRHLLEQEEKARDSTLEHRESLKRLQRAQKERGLSSKRDNLSDRVSWKKVYIYLCAPFTDMHNERDYLSKRVFPRLKEWCERRKLRLIYIDQRWGISEFEMRSGHAVRVCLNSIDECRPFFISLLGQRCGWIPRQADISPETFAMYPGLREAITEGYSLVELEIQHALLKPFCKEEYRKCGKYQRAEHAFFYFRDASYLQELPDEPPQLRRIYAGGDDSVAVCGLQRLKDHTISATRRPIRQYRSKWSEQPEDLTPELALPLRCVSDKPEEQELWRKRWLDAGIEIDVLDINDNPTLLSRAKLYNAKITSGRLSEFYCVKENTVLGEVIRRDLEEAIAERYPEHIQLAAEEEQDELSKEIDLHEEVLLAHWGWEICKPPSFEALDRYVDSDNLKRPLVIFGESGVGKTTLLAHWLKQRETTAHAGECLIYRFVGASEQSKAINSLLNSIMREYKRRKGNSASISTDHTEDELAAWVDALTPDQSQAQTIVVIDALEKFHAPQNIVQFLPQRLPPGFKLILACDSHTPIQQLLCADDREQPILQEIPPMKVLKERRAFVERYLWRHIRIWRDECLQALSELQGSQNPLYLKILMEALHLSDNHKILLDNAVALFGDTPKTAFNGLLTQLESLSSPGGFETKQIVKLLFGYLAKSDNGLPLHDLVSAISKDLRIDVSESAELHDAIQHIMQLLKCFMMYCGNYICFMHNGFSDAAKERYN